jgi:DnaK suppressor protein
MTMKTVAKKTSAKADAPSKPPSKTMKAAEKVTTKSAKPEPKEAKKAKVVEEEAPESEPIVLKPRNKAQMEEASGLTKKQLEFLEGKLHEERVRVRESIAKHVSEATLDSEVMLPDEFDQASRHSDQAYLLRLADKERKLLMEVEHAIQKYQYGTYGVCEGTGEPIGYRRLEARPWARHSIEFKERLEREQGSRA